MIMTQNTNPNNAVDEGIQPTGKLSFRDYITTGISLALIKDGCYDAKITRIQFVPNKEDPEKDYLRLEINLPTLDNRTVVENRFVSGYFIFEREIKTQLGLADSTLPTTELFPQIIGKPIKVWYKTITSTKDNKRYQNLHFSEPLPEPTAAGAVPKF